MGAADCVVVGGGVVGCAVARALAADRDVLLLERDRIAGGATGKASGLLSLGKHYGLAPGAAAHACEFFAAYDGHRNVDYDRRARVALARPREATAAQAGARFLSDQGFDASYLDAEAFDQRYPGVFETDPFAGAVVVEGFGWVDPHTFTTALAAHAEARGAEVRTGVAAERILVEDGAVAGVETDEGTVEAPWVVAAAGWRTPQLLDGLLEVPVRPERYYTVNVETDREFADDYPMGEASDPWLYWRPAPNGDLHVGGGATMLDSPGDEEEDDVGAGLTDAVARHLHRRLQGFEEARLAGEDHCPHGDATTPDRFPILDAPAEAPDGLAVATGFSGYGVMAAPFAAELVRSLVAGEPAPFEAEHFQLDRFGDRGRSFDQPAFADFGPNPPISRR